MKPDVAIPPAGSLAVGQSREEIAEAAHAAEVRSAPVRSVPPTDLATRDPAMALNLEFGIYIRSASNGGDLWLGPS